MGGIDADRMARALEQLAQNVQFENPVDASLYFDSSFLPDDGSLMLK